MRVNLTFHLYQASNIRRGGAILLSTPYVPSRQSYSNNKDGVDDDGNDDAVRGK